MMNKKSEKLNAKKAETRTSTNYDCCWYDLCCSDYPSCCQEAVRIQNDGFRGNGLSEQADYGRLVKLAFNS